MNKIFACITIALLCLGVSASADVFNLGPGLTNLETVTVGNAGNAADTRYGSYGSVSYNYNIGKYEVTAAQYTKFLNAVAKNSDPHELYNSYMDSMYIGCHIQRTGSSNGYTYTVADDWANRPVNFVTFFSACRFANWLHNGQPMGNQDATTTEDGSYCFAGSYNGIITRKSNADWVIPNENEWYKAAYYDPNKQNGPGYWDYPTQNNTTPSNQVLSVDPGNNANFYDNSYSIGSPYYLNNVGEFGNSGSAYGTFDQGGNVWEYSEYEYNSQSGSCILRGGCFADYGHNSEELKACNYMVTSTWNAQALWGFRVANLTPVPEPSSILTLLSGLAGLGIVLRRKR